MVTQPPDDAEAATDAEAADLPARPVTVPGDAPAGAVGAAEATTGVGVGRDRIVRVDLWATVVFTVVSVGAAAWSGLVAPAVVVDLVLFVVGCGAFLYAYFRGIGRSRDDAITLAGLFFLTDGAAPRPVARALRLLLAVQVVVAVATAAARPFSSLAFGVLAPMFGLAMLAVWGAVHGRFPPRGAAPAATRATDGDEE